LRRRGLASESKSRGQVFEELDAGQRRIRQVHDRRALRSRRVQRGPDERRFAGASLAEEKRQTRPSCEPVGQVCQRLAVTLREEQEPRIRRQVERPFLKTVILLVHDYLSSFQATAATLASATATAVTEIAILRRRRHVSENGRIIGTVASTGR